MDDKKGLLNIDDKEFLEKFFDSNSYIILEKFLEKHNLKPDEEKQLLFKIISFAKNRIEKQRIEINKKNNEIQKIMKEKDEEMEKNTEDFLQDAKHKAEESQKMNESVQMSNDLLTKINALEEKSKEEIKKLKEQIQKNNESSEKKSNEQKIGMINLELNLKIEIFRINIDNLINYKRQYFYNLKVEYLEKEIQLNKIDKNKLTSLCNDFYSFKNIAIYRKITNILLKKVIDLYMNDLYIETTKNDEKKIKVKIKSNNYQNLNDIISFFFFLKKNSSIILHFLADSEDLIKKLNNIEPFNSQNIEKMKGAESFLKELKSNCTYQSLINTLNIETPLLLFYEESDGSKEKVEYKIKSLLISLNQKLEEECLINYDELLKNLKIQEKEIYDLIKKNENSSNISKQFDIEVTKLKKEENFLKEKEKLNKDKEELIKSFSQVMSDKKGVEKMLFTMIDFISLYKKDFRPFEICLKLFDKTERNKNVNFFEEEIIDFVQYFEENKNKF